MSFSLKKKRETSGSAGPKKKRHKVIKHGVPLIFGSNHWSSKIDVSEKEKIMVTPHKIEAMAGRKISKVVIGPSSYHGVMISNQGTVFSFGRNDQGQLGLGDTISRPSPRKLQLTHRVVDAACGRRHTILLLADGTVMAMGLNTSGQLGIGSSKTTNKETPVPLLFDFEGKIVKVACGNDFSMVLNEHGDLFAFGHPDKGCLGNGTTGEYFITASKLTYHFEFSPIKVNGWCDKDPDSLDSSRGNKETSVLVEDHVIIDVACGPEHTVAMTPDGRVFTWGFGGYGRLGHNTNENEMHPRLLMHMKPSNVHTGGACRIFAGGSSCFVESRTQKQMFFWGQLKASGEATMYPKRYEDISSVAPEVFDVGMKHVLVSDGTNTFSMGASPCYGELGYGESIAGRSSTVFQPAGPLNGIPVIGIACGISQTIVIADNSTEAARKALEDLPTVGMQKGQIVIS
jgi:alpha-tubulin suppressor-like RCC1 family protein